MHTALSFKSAEKGENLQKPGTFSVSLAMNLKSSNLSLIGYSERRTKGTTLPTNSMNNASESWNELLETSTILIKVTAGKMAIDEY